MLEAAILSWDALKPASEELWGDCAAVLEAAKHGWAASRLELEELRVGDDGLAAELVDLALQRRLARRRLGHTFMGNDRL